MILIIKSGIILSMMFSVGIVLAALVFFYAWVERRILARSQQRQGVALHAGEGMAVIAADFVKLCFKDNANRPRVGSLLVLLHILLPFIFYACIFQVFSVLDEGRGELFLLFFIVFIGVVLQRILVFLPIEERERFAISHTHVLLTLSVMAFLLSTLPPIIGVGSGSLRAIHQLQMGFPFILMLHSPGIFLSAVAGFVSVLVLIRAGSTGVDAGFHLGGAWGRAFFWIQRLWIVCFASLWVFIYFGGGPLGFIGFFGYLIRVGLVLSLLLWIHVSMPKSRITDLSQFLLQTVIPTIFISLLAELIWVAFVGGSPR